MRWLRPWMVLATLVACGRAPYVVLHIEDPNGLAAGAVAIAVGGELDALERTSIRGEELPVDITVTARETGERTVWVEAWDGERRGLARGRVRAMFSTLPGVSVLVELAMPCNVLGADGATCVRPETLTNDGICVESACVESRCGDDIVDLARGEECDFGARNSELPNAGCRSDCREPFCGDGILDDLLSEVCDGSALGELSCTSVGFYFGTIGCDAACQPNTVDCRGFCGDDELNGGEECDDTDRGGAECTDFGFDRGTLVCLADCTFSFAACIGICGDDFADPNELCDGTDLKGHTCAELGYYSGAPTCSASCDGLSPTGCSENCGDGTINGFELCDGGDLPIGADCPSLGYYAGTPGCSSSCDEITTGACIEYCGDGAINGGEECDGADQGGESCIDESIYSAGRYG